MNKLVIFFTTFLLTHLFASQVTCELKLENPKAGNWCYEFSNNSRLMTPFVVTQGCDSIRVFFDYDQKKLSLAAFLKGEKVSRKASVRSRAIFMKHDQHVFISYSPASIYSTMSPFSIVYNIQSQKAQIEWFFGYNSDLKFGPYDMECF